MSESFEAQDQLKRQPPKSRSLTPPKTRGFGMTRAGVNKARTTEEKPRAFPTRSGRKHRERPATTKSKDGGIKPPLQEKKKGTIYGA